MKRKHSSTENNTVVHERVSTLIKKNKRANNNIEMTIIGSRSKQRQKTKEIKANGKGLTKINI